VILSANALLQAQIELRQLDYAKHLLQDKLGILDEETNCFFVIRPCMTRKLW
jgi:hypothetical protein